MNGDMGAGTVKQAAAGAPASAPKHMAEGALPNTAIRRIRCCRMALQRQGFWQPLQGSVAVAKRSCYSNESEPVGGVQAFCPRPVCQKLQPVQEQRGTESHPPSGWKQAMLCSKIQIPGRGVGRPGLAPCLKTSQTSFEYHARGYEGLGLSA